MSYQGSGYPYPGHVLQRAPILQCPLTTNFRNGLECKYALNQCATLSNAWYNQTHDPRFEELRKRFDVLAYGRMYQTEQGINNPKDQSLQLQGACYLMDNEVLKQKIYTPYAVPHIDESLKTFHMLKHENQKTSETESPQKACPPGARNSFQSYKVSSDA